MSKYSAYKYHLGEFFSDDNNWKLIKAHFLCKYIRKLGLILNMGIYDYNKRW